MKVSVVIVNWNTHDILRESLKSIYEQTREVEPEIIVVDNASSDGSADMVKREFPAVRLIENDDNKGYGAAANQGMRIATGRYFLVLNSDIIICDAAVDKTIKYAEKHPEAAIVTCQVRQSRETIQMTCFRFPTVLNLFLSVTCLARVFKNNRFFGQERMLWWGRDSQREVEVASGMFLLVRPEAIEKVGMMDERFFLYYEETDWCRRFADAGWKVLFWPGAWVLHVHGGSQSSGQKAVETFAQQRKSLLLYVKKHHGMLACLAARCILVVSFGVRSFTWNMIAMLKGITGRSTAEARSESRNCWGVLKFCLAGD